MDIVDVPASVAAILGYLKQDVVLSLVIGSAVLFAIASAVKLRKQKTYRDERKQSLGFSNEEFNEFEHDVTTRAHIPLQFLPMLESDMKRRAEEFYQDMRKRRSCRFFSSDPVPEEIIDNVIKTAGAAPSAANLQPWTYVVVKDPEKRSRLREIIEEEEYINYTRRMGDRWVQDLEKFATNWVKPYITDAPYIILLFRHDYGLKEDNTKQVMYYKEISSAISAGFFLAALHNAGLVTVTSTPLHCGNRIKDLLDRPDNERLILLFPVGYPASDATVPNIQRKPVNEILVKI